jgi:hypothetical protein
MRTKTMILSALLGALGSVSVMAQTNVYSLNAVGYINVTVLPGFNIVTCPLITSPDNTVGTVFNNAASNYTHCEVYFWFPGNTPPSYSSDLAKNVGTANGPTTTVNTNGWTDNGTNVLAPGTACWFENNFLTNITITFVGTVPTGPITNNLVYGFNLAGSVVPTSGDLVTNSISALTNYNLGDVVYTYDATNTPVYTTYTSTTHGPPIGGHGYDGNWTSAGDPVIPNVGQGFWYENNTVGSTVAWVENYSVSQ